MDFRKIESFLGIDTDEAEELGRILADNLATNLDKIRLGISESDAQSIAFAAHSIKGATGNLGFAKFAKSAALIEVGALDGQLDGFEDLLLDMQALLEKLESSLAGQ